MPNWASCSYAFVGKEKDLQQIQEELTFVMHIPSPPGYLQGGLWYLNAFIYPEHYASPMVLQPVAGREKGSYIPLNDCRGTIEDVLPIVPHPHRNSHVLVMHTEEAWGAHPEIVHYYAKARNCAISYICTEIGNQVFAKYDPCDYFGDYDFYIDDYSESTIWELSYDDLFSCPQNDNIMWKQIANGKFLDWCNANNETINADNVKALAVRYTDYMNAQETDYDEDLYVYEFEPEDILSHLPLDPPPYEPPTDDNDGTN